MSNLVFYSQFNVDCPEARRVIPIPKETTGPRFSRENVYTLYTLYPGANFIELLSRENCLPEIFA